LSPGNEQRGYWGSQAADQPGSRNLIGIKNPAVDKLIDRVVFAKSREELVAATKALDRTAAGHGGRERAGLAGSGAGATAGDAAVRNRPIHRGKIVMFSGRSIATIGLAGSEPLAIAQRQTQERSLGGGPWLILRRPH
jgi:hypothetical protein